MRGVEKKPAMHRPPGDAFVSHRAFWLGNAPEDAELSGRKIRNHQERLRTSTSYYMQIQLNLPADLMTSEFDLKMRLVSHLFAEGMITSGQGAKMVGISRRTFIELLGQYEVSAFQTSEDELLADIANA